MDNTEFFIQQDGDTTTYVIYIANTYINVVANHSNKKEELTNILHENLLPSQQKIKLEKHLSQNESYYQVTEKRLPAYIKFLEVKYVESIAMGDPAMPREDDKLMISWYFERLANKQKLDALENLETSTTTIELNTLEELIKQINKEWKQYTPNGIAKQPFPSREEREHDNMKAFEKWLIQRKELITTIDVRQQPRKKLQWNGNVALLGHLFLEFFEKGYVPLPKHKTDGSYNKLAEICYEHFDIRNQKGEIASLGYVKKQFHQSSNALSDLPKRWIDLPHLEDIK